MLYEIAIPLTIFCAIVLPCLAYVFGMMLYHKYIDKKIERKYPDYIRACNIASACDKEAAQYYNKHISKYENKIEKKERELRWLPRTESDEVIEEIETLKKQRLVYFTNYKAMCEDATNKWKNVEAIVNAHPFLRKHRG